METGTEDELKSLIAGLVFGAADDDDGDESEAIQDQRQLSLRIAEAQEAVCQSTNVAEAIRSAGIVRRLITQRRRLQSSCLHKWRVLEVNEKMRRTVVGCPTCGWTRIGRIQD